MVSIPTTAVIMKALLKLLGAVVCSKHNLHAHAKSQLTRLGTGPFTLRSLPICSKDALPSTANTATNL